MEKKYIVKEVFKNNNEEEKFKLICETITKIVKQEMKNKNDIDKENEELD